jgi:serine phosphatase RsbU (regulator of sigma subunit)/pSer/pThr/pTyr-binding forkhead associated (FHA) protein
MPWLKMLKGGTPGRTFPLDRDVVVLGRDSSCEIVLDDHEVSKRHARISRKDDGLYIEDLQSTNGTRVGDQDLTGCHRLQEGDLIEICGMQFVFAEGEPLILSVLDVSSTDEREFAWVRPEEKLHAILEMARNLGGTIDLDGVLGNVLETLFRVLPQAERGFILLRGEGTDELSLRASRVRNPEDDPPLFSRTIFNHVTNEAQAVLCQDIGADHRFGQSPSVQESRIRTMMCVPLWGRDRHPFGVLQVDTRDEDGRFQPDDLDLLAAVAGPVSVAIENALLHDVAVEHAKWEQEARDARAVQLALIPKNRPHLPDYAFWDHYQPARYVGGDYFDYRPVPRVDSPLDHPAPIWAITLGDVVGKGMPAALLMARLSSEVGLLLQTEPGHARIVERLNRSLCQSGIDEKFITFLLVLLDGRRHELTVVNAGHMGPMIRRCGGEVEVIGEERSGPPLGIIDDFAYETVVTTIGCGDVAVLYTDGVNEAMDTANSQFGFERLREVLSHSLCGASAVGEAILAAVGRHAAGRDQSDDIALLCFGRI